MSGLCMSGLKCKCNNLPLFYLNSFLVWSLPGCTSLVWKMPLRSTDTTWMVFWTADPRVPSGRASWRSAASACLWLIKPPERMPSMRWNIHVVAPAVDEIIALWGTTALLLLYQIHWYKQVISVLLTVTPAVIISSVTMAKRAVQKVNLSRFTDDRTSFSGLFCYVRP